MSTLAVHPAGQRARRAVRGKVALRLGATTDRLYLPASEEDRHTRCALKNGFVLAGVMFGHASGDADVVHRALLATLAFCLAASATYAVNDVVDRVRDTLHPGKATRPVPSGRLAPRAALALAAVLLIAAMIVASFPAGRVAAPDTPPLSLWKVASLRPLAVGHALPAVGDARNIERVGPRAGARDMTHFRPLPLLQPRMIHMTSPHGLLAMPFDGRQRRNVR